MPEASVGDIMGDLYSRRGKITEQRPDKGGTFIVRAHVPLAEMFGYATTMRSMSQGRATYSMEPSHYEPVPSNIQEEILSKGKEAIGSRR
jgi:elongation factor G